MGGGLRASGDKVGGEEEGVGLVSLGVAHDDQTDQLGCVDLVPSISRT